MKKNFLYMCALVLLLNSCNDDLKPVHIGKKSLQYELTKMDSIVIDADSLSGNGNFYMRDSVLTFADMTLCSLFHFDVKNGKLIKKVFTKGNGRNEIPSLMYSYPLFGANDDESYAMDSSLGMYILDEEQGVIKRTGRLDFSWEEAQNDYDSPSLYNLMFMTDFGMKICSVDDSTWMVPVSIIDRNLADVTKERYEKGHIFAEVDSRNYKVKNLFGRFPYMLKEKPSNLFEFFQYEKCGDTLYVNNCVDSLVYVYKYPDELLYTFGYEVKEAHRNYSSTLTADHSLFQKEAAKVSLNTGLCYAHGLLIRTTMIDMLSGKSVMQVYAGNDLVGEFDMPDMFRFLGYWNGYYYGTSFVPRMNEDSMSFILYRYKIGRK